jgi:hypothetical protein
MEYPLPDPRLMLGLRLPADVQERGEADISRLSPGKPTSCAQYALSAQWQPDGVHQGKHDT